MKSATGVEKLYYFKYMYLKKGRQVLCVLKALLLNMKRKTPFAETPAQRPHE